MVYKTLLSKTTAKATPVLFKGSATISTIASQKQTLSSSTISIDNNTSNNYSTSSSLNKENYSPRFYLTKKGCNISVFTKNSFKNYSTTNNVHLEKLPSNSFSLVTKENKLDPTEYIRWSREDVYSLLCKTKLKGGAGLTTEEVTPLYDAGFNGKSLDNVVQCLLMEMKDLQPAIKKRTDTVDNISPSFTTVPRDTIVTVVNWVENLLNTRLYHLWGANQVEMMLNSSIRDGGAGLSKDQLQPFVALGFKGKDLVDLMNDYEATLKELAIYSNENVKTSNQIIEWVLNLHINTGQKLYVPQCPTSDIVMDTTDEKHLPKPVEFTKEELIFLGKLCDMKLNSIIEPDYYALDSFTFELKNRDDSINKIKDGITQYYSVYKDRRLTKQEVPFILARGGSGSGKSRILSETSKIIRNIDIDIFKRTKVIYFNFLNGFTIDTPERDKNHFSMITARIIYASFYNAQTLAMKIPHQHSNINLLYEVFKIISKKLHEKENIDMSVPIPIVVAFDEFQYATRKLPDMGTSIKHLLSLYIRTYQKEHGLIIIPAFGGTLTSDDIIFKPTDHLIDLPLPCLRDSDTASIISAYAELKPYYTNRSKLNGTLLVVFLDI